MNTDVAADQFRELKGVPSILTRLLSAEEMYISRIVLRTLRYMAYGHEEFQQELIRSGATKKIMRCLSHDDEDVKYWCILCIHALASEVDSHVDIIESEEFPQLLGMGSSRRAHVAIHISDILSLICCISNNSKPLEPHIGILVPKLRSMIVSDEIDVQYNAVGAMFNLMAMRGTEKRLQSRQFY